MIVDRLDILSMMMDWEEGTLMWRRTLVLFSTLIRTGLIWQLQGCYGRMAHNLLEAGVIKGDGEIDWERAEDYFEEVEEGGG